MRCFAEQRGYDPEFWGIVGLLHEGAGVTVGMNPFNLSNT